MSTDNAKPQGYWRVPEYIAGLPAEFLTSLEAFYWDLIRFNQKLNLIPKKSELDGDISHIYDCVIGSQIILEATKAPVIHDMASGNGLPSLIMAALDPARKIIVIEPDEKKMDFLKYMAERIGAKNVQVVRGRPEDLPAGEVNCGVIRSVSRITKAILPVRGAVKVGGEYYHLKGSGWVREVAEIPSQICTVWSPRLVKEYDLPVISTRMAVICTKRVGT
ncbi:MAG: 16S rRNA (guanine(527)-N(7))-methyltransferase RsmG [Bdellovibrionales bacterium]